MEDLSESLQIFIDRYRRVCVPNGNYHLKNIHLPPGHMMIGTMGKTRWERVKLRVLIWMGIWHEWPGE